MKSVLLLALLATSFFTVASATEFSDDVTCDASLTVDGTSTFNGDVSFNGIYINGGSGHEVDAKDQWIFWDAMPEFATVSTQTTIGSAGSADALPSNPLGYVKFTLNGNDVGIPYYNLV